MNAPGDTILLVILAAALMACSGYAAGRLHQRRESGPEREAAYREGYDAATRDVFGMAARAAGREALAPSAGRHAVPDELVEAATRLLTADRMARARVPRPRS
ncbi:hypothetical protein [Actinoplanes utahensis]|uniref:Uncharacterized protein n=1 Tax=Actinoplanes utahensis TaxID=1869 RepID=A0A0A6UQH5_ACTUT|nr:hypothetical protein [Actinoplanes utahensis]KHD78375.1 hypothetical protein MB27_05980 [Actinoplanes utahensis]GIF28992.1 hypothetical protein Aut01nite_19780 [Actinoplanes utahensis]